jgi:DNA polymerase V
MSINIFTNQNAEFALNNKSNQASTRFPSPGEDYFEINLDLNRELIKNPSATFYARVKGVSMKDAGIDDGDLLVIDKSLDYRHNAITRQSRKYSVFSSQYSE